MSVSTSEWIKGISLSILASMFGGASKLALRKSFLIEQELASALKGAKNQEEVGPDDHASARRKAMRTRRIAAGLRLAGMFGMTVLNPLCGVWAIVYASPSIVAPFAGITLVWIVLFSEMLIGERPSYRQVFAAFLIVAGEVVIAVFGDHTNDEDVTLADLEQSYREPTFRIFIGVMVVWLSLIFYWMDRAKSPVLKRFAWGVAGGTITGFQNFVKDWMTVIKADEGFPWYFYFFLFMAMTCALSGLIMLNGCMQRYDATYSGSTFVGSFVVTASVMSAAHYNTFQNLDGMVNYILYPVGLLILMAGVGILVQETKFGVAESYENNESDALDSTDDKSDWFSRLMNYVGLSLIVQEIRDLTSSSEQEGLLNGAQKPAYNGA